MKDLQDMPDIVKDLLDPYVSSNDTRPYAFLLCVGANNWKLIGCPTFISATTLLPSKSTPEDTKTNEPLPYQPEQSMSNSTSPPSS